MTRLLFVMAVVSLCATGALAKDVPPDAVPLRDYLETRIEAAKNRLDARIGAVEQAVEKSEGLLNIRLEGMNEFRAALKDQTDQMMPRNEASILLENIRGRLRALEDAKSKGEGQSIVLAGLAALAGAVVTGIIVSAVVRFIK